MGPERAKAIKKELVEQSDFIDELLEAVILSESRNSENENLPTICFTGKMPEKRSYYEDLAKSKGFHAVDTVSKELSLLVAADITGSSSKLVKAAKLGVRVMALEEFMTMETASAVPSAPAEKSLEAEKAPTAASGELPLFPETVDTEKSAEKSADKPEQLSFGF